MKHMITAITIILTIMLTWGFIQREVDDVIKQQATKATEAPVSREPLDLDKRINEIRSELGREPVEVIVPTKTITRYRWEAPDRGEIWAVPEADHQDATLTAFLRVCLAEADGAPQDCVGIWQVIKNNRRRSCNRPRNRVTECDENGETFLSALRRHQRHVLGMIPLRNRRARWITKLETDCEPPPGFTIDQWDSRYASRCQHAVQMGQYLVKGKLPPSRPGHRLKWLPGTPITWGGRCETKRGSCDDRIACARGLVRIDTRTENAFWRRARTQDEVDPVCRTLGYGVVKEGYHDTGRPTAEIPTPHDQSGGA